MAQGDLTIFNQFKVDIGLGLHDLDTSSDVVKIFFTDGTTTLAAGTSDPRYGAAGGTNLSLEETSGGNFTAGGDDITNTYAASGSGAKFDGTDPATWSKNASNPSDLRYAVFYNDTDAGKRCIGFIDLGAVVDATAGDLTITYNASGIFTLT